MDYTVGEKRVQSDEANGIESVIGPKSDRWHGPRSDRHNRIRKRSVQQNKEAIGTTEQRSDRYDRTKK
jgi:hypothetical protein